MRPHDTPKLEWSIVTSRFWTRWVLFSLPLHATSGWLDHHTDPSVSAPTWCICARCTFLWIDMTFSTEPTWFFYVYQAKCALTKLVSDLKMCPDESPPNFRTTESLTNSETVRSNYTLCRFYWQFLNLKHNKAASLYATTRNISLSWPQQKFKCWHLGNLVLACGAQGVQNHRVFACPIQAGKVRSFHFELLEHAQLSCNHRFYFSTGLPVALNNSFVVSPLWVDTLLLRSVRKRGRLSHIFGLSFNHPPIHRWFYRQPSLTVVFCFDVSIYHGIRSIQCALERL